MPNSAMTEAAGAPHSGCVDVCVGGDEGEREVEVVLGGAGVALGGAAEGEAEEVGKYEVPVGAAGEPDSVQGERVRDDVAAGVAVGEGLGGVVPAPLCVVGSRVREGVSKCDGVVVVTGDTLSRLASRRPRNVRLATTPSRKSQLLPASFTPADSS